MFFVGQNQALGPGSPGTCPKPCFLRWGAVLLGLMCCQRVGDICPRKAEREEEGPAGAVELLAAYVSWAGGKKRKWGADGRAKLWAGFSADLLVQADLPIMYLFNGVKSYMEGRSNGRTMLLAALPPSLLLPHTGMILYFLYTAVLLHDISPFSQWDAAFAVHYNPFPSLFPSTGEAFWSQSLCFLCNLSLPKTGLCYATAWHPKWRVVISSGKKPKEWSWLMRGITSCACLH